MPNPVVAHARLAGSRRTFRAIVLLRCCRAHGEGLDNLKGWEQVRIGRSRRGIFPSGARGRNGDRHSKLLVDGPIARDRVVLMIDRTLSTAAKGAGTHRWTITGQ